VQPARLAAASVLVFAHSLGEFGVILKVGGSIPAARGGGHRIYEPVEPCATTTHSSSAGPGAHELRRPFGHQPA
jgi:ABC-type molybdate transport system permease subunit